MKKIILIFLFNSFICLSQTLDPAENFENYEGVLKAYYDNVIPLIYKDFNDEPKARYTSMPSFTNEYAFSLSKKDNKYYIISNELSENYWYAKNKKNVKVLTRKTIIEKYLYLKIIELFNLLTEQIEEKEDLSIMFDGTSYYFTANNQNGEIITGKTKSPNEDSLFGKIVKVCDNVFYYDKKSEITQKEINLKIDTIILELKK